MAAVASAILVGSGLATVSAVSPADAAPRAQASFQELSDIQSDRWIPSEVYVSETMFVNSTGQTLYLEANLSDVESGKWRKAPPPTVAPGALVNIQALDDRLFSVYGHQMQFGYRSADGRKLITYRIENKPFQKNKHVVLTRGFTAGAVDGWNQAWNPGTLKAARVDSDTIGPSNWAVVALEVTDSSAAPGAGLPRGEWSKGICSGYLAAINAAGWTDGRWKDYWQDGSAGALAGGYLGWFGNRC